MKIMKEGSNVICRDRSITSEIKNMKEINHRLDPTKENINQLKGVEVSLRQQKRSTRKHREKTSKKFFFNNTAMTCEAISSNLTQCNRRPRKKKR